MDLNSIEQFCGWTWGGICGVAVQEHVKQSSCHLGQMGLKNGVLDGAEIPHEQRQFLISVNPLRLDTHHMVKTGSIVRHFMCICNCCYILFQLNFYTGEGAQSLHYTQPSVIYFYKTNLMLTLL